MTQRDRGLIGALLAIFVVLAVVVALPAVSPATGPAATPASASPAASSQGPSTSNSGQASSSPAPAASGVPSSPANLGGSPAPTGTIHATNGTPVLRHGVVSSPTSINPLTARTQADRDLVALVFSGLVRLGPKDAVVGDLADRWNVDRTGKVWTFHIRDGERWHDGEPVTANDVVFTVNLLRHERYTGPLAGSWSEISARRIDAQTVRFTLRTPLGDFLQIARQPLLPAHLLANVAPDQLADSAFSSAPVGSGPFRLLRWDSSVALLERTTALAAAVASASAAGSPAPSVAPGTPQPIVRIRLQFYADAVALAGAYRAGELDMADGLPATTARGLDDMVPGARIVRYPRTTLTAVLLNLRTNHPTTRDQTVRQALLMAIDRISLVNDLLGGLGHRADSLVPPQSWAYVVKSAKAMPFSTSRAAKLLQGAGWREVNGKWHPPGSRNIFTIEIVTTTKAANPVAFDAAQFVARAWRAFGITVKVVPLPPVELVGERLARANFTAAVVDINVGLDPDLYPLLASRQAGIGGSNLSGVQSLVLDELLIKARTPGPLAERRNAWAKLEQFLSTSQVTLPLAFRDDALVVSDSVTGPSARLLGDLSDRFWDVLSWRLASGR